MVCAALAPTAAAPVAAQDTHLLVIVGIGGDPEYKQQFLDWGTTLRSAAMEGYGLPAERAVLLSEDPDMSPAASGDSRRESIEAELAGLATRVGSEDRVLIVLIGHGSFRGGAATFNIPGPDLPAPELGELLDALPTSRVALVNTSSASGPYVEALSAPGRTVITATASGNERNVTQFGGYFVEAWSGDTADLDKNGVVSLLEAFQYARVETARFYEEQNLLLTEHALLDDDGDAEGAREPSIDTSDGAVAAAFTLGVPGRASSRAGTDSTPTSDDPELNRLYQERADLEGRVAELRRLRDAMDPEVYERELEELLVDLALKNREIRAREGGE